MINGSPAWYTTASDLLTSDDPFGDLGPRRLPMPDVESMRGEYLYSGGPTPAGIRQYPIPLIGAMILLIFWAA